LAETFTDFFNALLFGSGSWLGFLLIIAVVVCLLIIWKYAGILTFFATIFIAVTYIQNDLLYHSLGMFVAAIFSLIVLIKKH